MLALKYKMTKHLVTLAVCGRAFSNRKKLILDSIDTNSKQCDVFCHRHNKPRPSTV